MNKQDNKELVSIIQKSISETLENHPGIEKYIDWFTLMAPINQDLADVKKDLEKETILV